MSRPRDYAYEALAEVSGSDPTQARGQLNAALKSIREQSEIEDSYLLADEIHTRAKLYRQVMPDVMLTPNALAKHWLRVFEEAEQRRTKGTNTHSAVTECLTCDGDRFVLVGTRQAKASSWMQERKIQVPEAPGMEEYAACPDCSTADTGFFRHDGSKSRALDPAEVRERMAG